MITLVGWSQSLDTSGVLTPITAIPDPHLRTNGNDIIVPAVLNKLMLAAANGATMTQAQMQSPTLRRTMNLDIPHPNVGANFNSLYNYLDRLVSPVDLDPAEALNAFVAEGAAGAERENVFAILGDGDLRIPTGDVYVARFTATTTLSAFGWTNCPITFTQTLPAGLYAVVGAHVFSAGLLAYRLVFPGYSWRPGGLGVLSTGQAEPMIFRNGALGEWGRFAHNAPPTIDCCSTTADTAETGFLEVIKLAGA